MASSILDVDAFPFASHTAVVKWPLTTIMQAIQVIYDHFVHRMCSEHDDEREVCIMEATQFKGTATSIFYHSDLSSW